MLRILFLLTTSFAVNATCHQLASEFIDHRIFVSATLNGKSGLFFTDSGGGLFPFVYRETAKKFGLKIEQEVEEDGMKIGFTSFPDDLAKTFPQWPQWKSKVRVFTARKDGEDEISLIQPMVRDGFLGATFYAAGKIWHLDYLNQKIAYCEKLPSMANHTSMPIYFRQEKGVRTIHQPRMEMMVQGKKYPMLFDTGATSLYSEEAQKLIQVKAKYNGSSFIRASVAQAWKKSNPAWRTIEKGDMFGRTQLIEVPEVEIAGHKVGPVWFATRKDEIYDHYSKTYMDGHIDGAVGGNVFRFFNIFADYESAKLYFQHKKSR